MVKPTFPRPKPLQGIRVLEVGQLIAGPFAGCLLGYFGADVIKIETPGKGDPVRNLRGLAQDGVSMWWRSLGRNKKSVTLNMRHPQGQKLFHQLSNKCDVLIENFKPGTMEKWNLGPDVLTRDNPSLIYTRVSGYGQTGPYSHKPGFASAMGGFRYVTGYPNEAPVRPNISLGDSLAGLHAAFGIVLSLLARNKHMEQGGSGKSGQVVDVAIYESVFNMMESVLPEYQALGMKREPSGTTVTGIVPTNAYKCKDDKYIIIGANGDSLYQRLMNAAGRQDLADDPECQDNAGRVKHQERIDSAIEAWTNTLSSKDVLAQVEKAQVPAGPIYSISDIVQDPHYKARDMFESVDIHGQCVHLPALAPKLLDTPGTTEWPGPELGQHTDLVLTELLGLSKNQVEQLRLENVI